MATKWVGQIPCGWCDAPAARTGIERDGEGRTFRVHCRECGLMAQVAFHYPAGRLIAAALAKPADDGYGGLLDGLT